MFSENNIGINGKSQQKSAASPLIVSSEREPEGPSKLYTLPKIFVMYFMASYVVVRTVLEIVKFVASGGVERGRHAMNTPLTMVKGVFERFNCFPTAMELINTFTAQSSATAPGESGAEGGKPKADLQDAIQMDLSLWQRQLKNIQDTFAAFGNNPFDPNGSYKMAHGFWEEAKKICAKFQLHRLYATFDEYLSWSLEQVGDLAGMCKALKDGELFHDCVLFFQMLVSYGVCKPLSYTYNDMLVYEIGKLPKVPTLYEVVTQAFTVVQRVCESLLRFIKSGKLVSLVKNDKEVQFQNDYSTLLTNCAMVEIGADEDICNKFDGDLAKCLADCERLLSSAKANDRGRYTGYMVNLKRMGVDRSLQQKERMREKPFGLLLYGEPGVGKSAIIMPLMHLAVVLAGGSGDPSRCIVMNPEDSFQSEYRTDVEGVVIDDVCQMNTKYMQNNPHTMIIQFLNNVPMAALMPEAEKKGKVMIRPQFVAVTTNVKDLKAPELSNAPGAILRRFDFIITQIVKEEYCKPGTNMLDPALISHMSNQEFPDYALFTVETAASIPNTSGNQYGGAHSKPPGAVQFTPVVYKGQVMKDISIAKLLEFLAEEIPKQRAQQRAFVKTQHMTKHERCEHGMPVCACQKCIDKSILEIKKLHEATDADWDPELSDVEELEAQMGIPYYNEIAQFLYAFETECMVVVNALLQELLTWTFVQHYLSCYLIGYMKKEYVHSLKYYLTVVFMLAFNESTFGGHPGRQIIVVTMLYLAWLYAEWCRLEKEMKASFILPRPSEYIKKHKIMFQGGLVLLLCGLGCWSVLALMASAWKNLNQQSGSDEVKVSSQDVFAAIIPSGKPWQNDKAFWDEGNRGANRIVPRTLVSSASVHTSAENLRNIVAKRLHKAINEATGEHFNVLPVQANIFMIPAHVVTDDEYDITILINGQSIKGCKVSRVVTVCVPNSDIAFLYVPNVPPQKDLSKFFAQGSLDGKVLTGQLLYNDGDKVIEYPSMALEMRDIVSTKAKFHGGRYMLPSGTFCGLCGGVVIAQTRDKTDTRIPFILGIHLAGKDEIGAAGYVTQDMIRTAVKELNGRSFIMTQASESYMPANMMGIDLHELAEPHPKCVTHDLGKESMITVLGGIDGHMSKRKTQVTQSKISPWVESIMGIEVQHKVPEDLNARIHRHTSIMTKSRPAINYNSATLELAYKDFEARLKSLPQSEFAQLGKLDNDRNVSGADGVIAINAISLDTSMGYPLSGPKRPYFPESERVVEGITCVRDIHPLVLEEMERIESELAIGNRCNTVFTCAVKDEAVKKTKNVSRIFVGANAPFTLEVRKFFLPICALMQRNPRVTECAAGIVVQSPQWGEMFEYISEFGEDRLIAGDYKAFDSTMGPIILKAAFKLMISLAEYSGKYTLRDLTIMRGIADEITYANVNCFNTLIIQAGTNPSGHALTVQTNSIVNSLLLRYAYYEACNNAKIARPLPFHEVARATTYGDDNLIGTKKGHDYFNHTSIAEILGKVGIVYTMADKEAETRPYINLSEASFLKHYAVKDPKTGFWRSPCEESSLAKMLHFHRKSDILTENESCVESLQNAALKFFEFGEEVYTKRRDQMLQVAEAAGIMGDLVGLPTYAELDAWYREKFDL